MTNRRNVAAVTLQENNHIVLVHLPTAKVVRDFSAGAVDLRNVDVEDDGLILRRRARPGAPAAMRGPWTDPVSALAWPGLRPSAGCTRRRRCRPARRRSPRRGARERRRDAP